jgi:hypothetical protein
VEAAGRDQPRQALARSVPAHPGPRFARADLRLVTEGFDTADLKNAKALLDELASAGQHDNR